MKSDYDLIGRSLEDVIIEPVRSILIPGFDDLKKACKAVGALGGGISGSGPSIFFLSKENERKHCKHVQKSYISETYMILKIVKPQRFHKIRQTRFTDGCGCRDLSFVVSAVL
jgi:homoserine kinase